MELAARQTHHNFPHLFFYRLVFIAVNHAIKANRDRIIKLH